jgi:prophage antirepressor-like protein
MNHIQIFQNEQFGKVRIVLDNNNEPLFCLTDVAKALGYNRPADAVNQHCKGVVVLPTPTNGGIQNIKFGKEGEVYRLTMKSKLPEAEKFQDWVCNDVLPSIRKHGTYMTEQTLEKALLSPDYLIRLATQIKEERQKRIEAEEANKQLSEANIYQTQVIEGLTKQIPLAEMRQRIVQIVQKGGPQTVRANWRLLYQEFDKKYHKNLTARMNNGGYKNKLDVIESLDMMPQLYDLACRLFESECEELIEAWGKTIKRASRERKLLYYKD